MEKETKDFILNALRQASIKWPGRKYILKKSRKRVIEKHPKTGRLRSKYFWQCNICKNWERDVRSIEVDHKVEIGLFSDNLFKQIEVMFDETNLQCLCVSCHAKKTATFNSTLLYRRKNRPMPENE